MRFEVAGKKIERALNWRAGHGDQRAEPFAFVEREYLAELFEYRPASLALLNFL